MKVTPGHSGTPTGTVTVTAGTKTVCTITLSGGTGSCPLTATQLAARTALLTASYGGDARFGASASPAEPLTVTKATTATVLRVTATKVTYGRERAEELTRAADDADALARQARQTADEATAKASEARARAEEIRIAGH